VTGGAFDHEAPSAVLKVSNLHDVAEHELEPLFAAHATVREVVVKRDRETYEPKGFGFVTLASPEEAGRCIQQLQGAQLRGRRLRLSYAAPRESLPGANPEPHAHHGAEGGNPGTWQPQEYREGSPPPSGGAEPKPDAAQGGAEAAEAGAPTAIGDRYVWDGSGYYYDTCTGYHYDPSSGLLYNAGDGKWYVYDSQRAQYLEYTAGAGPAAPSSMEAGPRDADSVQKRRAATVGSKPMLNAAGLAAAARKVAPASAGLAADGKIAVPGGTVRQGKVRGAQ